ncbi:MAG: SGNH/GDSL hydrolase family protein [Bacteroidota bacterium]
MVKRFLRKRVFKIGLTAGVLLLLSSFSKKEIVWVTIGDSITYLNEHLNETGDRVTKGYQTRVKEKLGAITYYNQGHNGWTAVGIAKEFDKLGVQKGDVYSIFLGTNDWWSGLPLGNLNDYKEDTGLKTVCGAFRVIVNKIKLINPEAKIIMITPMQRTDFVYLFDKKNNAWGSDKARNDQFLSAFADAVVQIAKYEHFDIVDLYHKKEMALKNLVYFKQLKDPGTGEYKNYSFPDFSTIPFNPADDYPYPAGSINVTYDGLHPSDKGYEIIANMLTKVLKKYLN